MTQVHDSEKTDPQGKSAKFAKKPYDPWEPMKQVPRVSVPPWWVFAVS
jgi:hypothetical protein